MKPGDVIGTVSAGDAFTAGVIGGVIECRGIEEIANYANLIAPMVCVWWLVQLMVNLQRIV